MRRGEPSRRPERSIRVTGARGPRIAVERQQVEGRTCIDRSLAGDSGSTVQMSSARRFQQIDRRYRTFASAISIIERCFGHSFLVACRAHDLPDGRSVERLSSRLCTSLSLPILALLLRSGGDEEASYARQFAPSSTLRDIRPYLFAHCTPNQLAHGLIFAYD